MLPSLMPDSASADGLPDNTQTLLFALVSCIVVPCLYYSTTAEMVDTWIRSETYAHGFLIFPISIWLAWDCRDSWSDLPTYTTAKPLLFAIPVAALWFVANAIGVSVVQQLCLVTLVILTFVTVAGYEVSRALAFPLGFLYLSVPMGEGLVAPMMEFTATSTVWMIEQTGIPVYREGLHFMLPTGNWSVVEACSGVRYLIASFTLGVLFAHLTYHSLGRKLLFVLASIIVPVIANTLRAYMIVMLGHLSDMQVATGVDHLIYGWVFFGVVVMALFAAGSLFRDEAPSTEPVAPADAASSAVKTGRGTRSAAGGSLVAVLVLGLWPALSVLTGSSPVAKFETGLPDTIMTGTRVDYPFSWVPGKWPERADVAGYAVNSSTFGIAVVPERKDEEVIGTSRRWLPPGAAGRVSEKSRQTINSGVGRDGFVADHAILVIGGQRLEAWSWYAVGGRLTSNNYTANLLRVGVQFGVFDDAVHRVVVVAPAGTPEALQFVQAAADVLR